MVDFWQIRLPQRWQHQCRAAAFYSAKSRQDSGLTSLASRGGPVSNEIGYAGFMSAVAVAGYPFKKFKDI